MKYFLCTSFFTLKRVIHFFCNSRNFLARMIKAALAVNFIFFLSSPNLHIWKIKKYKRLFFFCLERNQYCSTFMINIESSLIHSMNIFICLKTKLYWYPVLAAFQKLCGVCFKISYLMTNQSFFNFQMQYFPGKNRT